VEAAALCNQNRKAQVLQMIEQLIIVAILGITLAVGFFGTVFALSYFFTRAIDKVMKDTFNDK
jgi:low temperature requirement protein LtrA